MRPYRYLIICICLIECNPKADHFSNHNWAYYQGDPGRNQFKSFDQINVGNAHQLIKVWEYHSENDTSTKNQIQCNPLIIDGVLYGTSPKLKLFALNAATGVKKWEFDPTEKVDKKFGTGVNRGLSYWNIEDDKRIFYSVGPNLFAIDANTGMVINSFGQNGSINLKKGLGRNIDKAYFVNNTPGVIFRNLLVVGGRTSEGADHAPGHIRAYNVLSGKLEWIFHTIPHPGEFGHDTWPDSAYVWSGGANAWSGFSIDHEAEIIYAPTGSPSFDFYGGDRHGKNLFANSIIALNANTGERIWHFQARHHDLWDRDLPAPPNLLDIKKDGKIIKALVQISKSAHLFVLDRITGQPIYPIEEVEAKPSELDGESAWPTQPVPMKYPQFSRNNLTKNDLTIRNSQAQSEALAIWDNTNVGEFVPPSLKSLILFPGMDGGGEWGGAAADPEKGILYVNSNDIPWQVKMEKYIPKSLGQSIYQANCQSCHAKDFTGNQLFANVPDLNDVAKRLTSLEITNIIKNGKGVMPQFAQLSDEDIAGVIDFISGIEETELAKEQWPYPYFFSGYKKFQTSDGLPIIRPPWGQLTAIDLNDPKILWQVPLGNIDSLDIPGHTITGTENYGGPVVTGGGVIFIAATADEKFRVFDKSNGKLLWETKLPAGGYATPATYMVDDKQYVVIACGGSKLGTKAGDSYIAFTLQ